MTTAPQGESLRVDKARGEAVEKGSHCVTLGYHMDVSMWDIMGYP